MSEYLADTYQNAFQLGEAALKDGHGLTIDTDAGVDTYWGPDLARFMDELAPGEPFEIVALVPMPEAPEGEPACAWTITRDHLADAETLHRGADRRPPPHCRRNPPAELNRTTR